MKYISEERLETLLNNTSYITANDLLRVLINECKELNQWHPIETAPKDDTKVLLYTKEWGAIHGRWYLGIGWNCKGTELYPSHWMEIPEPPK